MHLSSLFETIEICFCELTSILTLVFGEEALKLSYAFSASIEMTKWFLFFNVVVQYMVANLLQICTTLHI